MGWEGESRDRQEGEWVGERVGIGGVGWKGESKDETEGGVGWEGERVGIDRRRSGVGEGTETRNGV